MTVLVVESLSSLPFFYFFCDVSTATASSSDIQQRWSHGYINTLSIFHVFSRSFEIVDRQGGDVVE